MMWPKLREIKEALTSFFSAPETTRYPAGPKPGFPSYRGFPRFTPEDCVGCGACAQVCPSQAIEAVDDVAARKRRLSIDFGSCMQCGQCAEKCITGSGVVNTPEYSLAVSDLKAPEVFETIEKDLILCEGCGAVIGCRDHLRWIKERLGAEAYAHPNLLLLTQQEWSPPPAAQPKDRLRREDQIKTVCARCRQKIVSLDEF
jgi:hydrogenase-4 component H